MSWYSQVYTAVRTLKQRCRCIGYCASALLYAPLVLQMIGICFSWFTYVVLMCLMVVESDAQCIVYLVVYHLLLGMTLWALIATLATPVARVPDIYHLDDDTDRRLREVSPQDKKTPPNTQQVTAQCVILDAEAARRRLNLHEIDEYNRLRYCYTCHVLKPDRAHHCSSCGYCVVKYDHHCPWVNKCVSYANYKFFLLYLAYGTLFVLWALATSIEAVVRFFAEQQWQRAHIFVPIMACCLIYLVTSYFPFIMLLRYHCQLVHLNETTCEQARLPKMRGVLEANYDQGKRKNVESVFGQQCSKLFWLCPVTTVNAADGFEFPINIVKPLQPSPPGDLDKQ